jgi:uncharacterized integral membrane protein
MGEKQVFQPLTREDRVTVLLYRSGIVLCAVFLSLLAALSAVSSRAGGGPAGPYTDMLAYGLYAATGMSVFFIHLYIGKLKIYLKNLYYISLVCLVALLVLGKGSLSGAIAQAPARALLLLPLSGCLGFVTAKEAFCFKLVEGYLLAMIMPLYLVMFSGMLLAARTASVGLVLIASLLVLFTLRKVFMPITYDIGDKSAYQ